MVKCLNIACELTSNSKRCLQLNGRFFTVHTDTRTLNILRGPSCCALGKYIPPGHFSITVITSTLLIFRKPTSQVSFGTFIRKPTSQVPSVHRFTNDAECHQQERRKSINHLRKKIPARKIQNSETRTDKPARREHPIVRWLVRSWYVVRSCPPFFFLFGSTDVEKLF